MVACDEVLVQVKREALKTKPPALTTNLNFTGKYLVLTTGAKHIGISTKLDQETRERLKSLIRPVCDGRYGFIVRTNAGTASNEEILSEADELIRQCEDLIEKAKYRSCFTRMYQTPPAWLARLRDTHDGGLSVVTDDRILYEQMRDYLQKAQPEDLHRLQLYEDPLLPLAKLYNLERAFRDALSERVWLRSGAYLVIQPTEALTVIDVNTGKYENKKKKKDDTFLKINLEAAAEIARQLRLRNISGIIVVDFINMESQEYKDTLMQALSEVLKRDPIKATLVDMTALHLVEITRKKVEKPLAEQVGKIEDFHKSKLDG
jgi:ribonuclease G